MGGGRGGGYSSNADRHVAANIASLVREFGPLTDGYFGQPGTSESIRRLTSSDPSSAAERFFKIASRNADKNWTQRPGLYRAHFRPNSHFIYRPVSKIDKSPAVSLDIPEHLGLGIRPQKIHFIK